MATRSGKGHDVIRLVIVDDDPMVRSGLAAILSVEPDLEVVGAGADGAEVPDLVRTTRPHVVLMDVRMPQIDGIEATRRLMRTPDPPAVVVVTTFENDSHVYDALLAGARGFVLKRADPDDLLAAIRTVAHTDSLVFPAAIRRVAAPRVPGPIPVWVGRITPREREVLSLVADGLTNAEIAAALSVSIETVKSHLKSLLGKAGARHRTELVVRSYQAGLVDGHAT